MTARRAGAAVVVLTALLAVLVAATARAPVLEVLALVTLAIAFAGAGVVALRRAGPTVPALALLGVGACHLLAFDLAGLAVLLEPDAPRLVVAVLGAVSGATYLLGFVALLLLAATLARSGPLPRAAARLLAAAAALAVAGPAVAALGSTQRLVVSLPGWPGALPGTAWAPGAAAAGSAAAVLLAAPVVAALTVAWRWHRARGATRARLAWPAAVLAVALAGVVAQTLLGRDLPGQLEALPVVLTLGAVPFALLPPVLAGGAVSDARMTAAVRTAVVLAALWTVAAVAYAGAAAVLGLRGTTRTGTACVLLVALAGAPVVPAVRRALAAAAERLALGPRVDGYALLREYGAVLAGATTRDEVCRGTASTLAAALGARWVEVRLADGAHAAVGGVRGATAVEVPLQDEAGRLGVVRCGERRRGSYGERDHEAVVLLARQTALGLRRLVLADELRARADELAASRHRLAVASDAERRRIERDLHDGVQQDLVALLSRVELARTLLGFSVEEAAQALDEARADAVRSIEALRRTVLGIHPPVLTDRGLVAAVAARVRELPLDVTLHVDPALRRRRPPVEVETAAYYLVVEGLTNVLKHAGVAAAEVSLELAGDDLVVRVVDEGRGGADATAGSGLAGIGDRLSAAGAQFEVLSPAGGGTQLQARLRLTSPMVDA